MDVSGKLNFKRIMKDVCDYSFDEKGLEVYPFKVKWYNDRVQVPFQLPYDGDTLAILITSTPKMFENSLLPFILSRYEEGSLDPVDQCFKEIFLKLQDHCKEYHTHFIQDYELSPSRRPKILLQTVGHISGAAYYYQQSDVPRSPWATDTTVYGVSVHPRYGGWFAFRGVMIFKDVQLSKEELTFKEPINCCSTEKRVIELLNKFNLCWQDWSYRDVLDGTVEERYSEQQKEYFSTLPKDRPGLVKKWINNK